MPTGISDDNSVNTSSMLMLFLGRPIATCAVPPSILSRCVNNPVNLELVYTLVKFLENTRILSSYSRHIARQKLITIIQL